jgi:phospholipase/carboxylesterase
MPDTGAARRGRLRLPATVGAAAPLPAGRNTVHVDGREIGRCWVPRAAERLVVVLHGAGGTADDALEWFQPYADDRGLVLFAPQSVGRTWDMILSGYGPDVSRIQSGLDELIGRRGVAAGKRAVAGFSDGASYAVSLGLINGDIVDAVLAFSPGYAAPTADVGDPTFFVSHGRSDRVLPIDRCSRRLVPALRRAGHRVEYREFDGGHELPAGVLEAAVNSWCGVPSGR